MKINKSSNYITLEFMIHVCWKILWYWSWFWFEKIKNLFPNSHFWNFETQKEFFVWEDWERKKGIWEISLVTGLEKKTSAWAQTWKESQGNPVVNFYKINWQLNPKIFIFLYFKPVGRTLSFLFESFENRDLSRFKFFLFMEAKNPEFSEFLGNRVIIWKKKLWRGWIFIFWFE